MRRIEDYVFSLTELYQLESTYASAESTGEAKDMFHDLLDSIDCAGSVADNLAKVMEIGNQIENLDENLVRPDRRYIHDGPAKIIPAGTKKPIADYVFLFNDVLLYCQTSGKTQSYVGRFYIHRLQYNADAQSKITLTIDDREKYEFVVHGNVFREWTLHFNKVIYEVQRTRKVFGVPLNVLMKRESENLIPTIVEKTIHFIYEYGMDKEGIFRQTGRSTQIDSLKDQLDQGANVFFSENMDVHSVAALFKLWLRELPEPLLTWKAYDKFMQVAAMEGEEQLEKLKFTLESIPVINQAVVQCLFKCLRAICDNEEKSKMNPGNLAVVFAPNILKNPDPNADPFDQSYYQNINIVFIAMLENFGSLETPVENLRRNKRKSKKYKDRKKSLRLTALGAPQASMVQTYEGQVFMQVKKKWVSKFVFLDTDSIIVKKNAKDKKGKKHSLAADGAVQPETNCEKPFAFSFNIIENDTSVKFIMAAKSSDQQAEWIGALQNSLRYLANPQ